MLVLQLAVHVGPVRTYIAATVCMCVCVTVCVCV